MTTSFEDAQARVTMSEMRVARMREIVAEMPAGTSRKLAHEVLATMEASLRLYRQRLDRAKS